MSHFQLINLYYVLTTDSANDIESRTKKKIKQYLSVYY